MPAAVYSLRASVTDIICLDNHPLWFHNFHRDLKKKLIIKFVVLQFVLYIINILA